MYGKHTQSKKNHQKQDSPNEEKRQQSPRNKEDVAPLCKSKKKLFFEKDSWLCC